ncbi:hypothetical protein A3A79_00200 [Candidatus Gottesmanbacteria bacterium RIFCSPLOWO2_01_FULL_43_11b]|uniref:DUF192 domain-containing protein n=1 Tax=Candidatus Gottesmanbacteria bacterium RIFCSPLOWO2_01_FULL_43_11b TaxID=1798392 RepID=A0A1F6AGQ2_9BACT|nr:MAG: hypothetical protein A3A79_00200 [Candidatus Gottesmanbacteria bacterium RIFCSPLOWO2_01_FULL_43_11b]
MKKILPFVIIILGILFLYYWKNPLSAQVKIRDSVFYVDLAIAPKDRERGLSGRKSMAQNRGVLFLFGSPGVYHFWMKDMHFPLDFIWISESTVVDIDENVPPPKTGEFPVELSPSQSIDKVLEVNGGVVKSSRIQIGDTLQFRN